MTLTVRADRELIRAAASSTRYLWVSFTAPAAPRRTEARAVLVRTVGRIRGYANGDRRLVGIADELERDVFDYEVPMSAVALKQAMYSADWVAKSRGRAGKAWKKGH